MLKEMSEIRQKRLLALVETLEKEIGGPIRGSGISVQRRTGLISSALSHLRHGRLSVGKKTLRTVTENLDIDELYFNTKRGKYYDFLNLVHNEGLSPRDAVRRNLEERGLLEDIDLIHWELIPETSHDQASPSLITSSGTVRSPAPKHTEERLERHSELFDQFISEYPRASQLSEQELWAIKNFSRLVPTVQIFAWTDYIALAEFIYQHRISS